MPSDESEVDRMAALILAADQEYMASAVRRVLCETPSLRCGRYISMARAVIADREKQDAAWVDRIGNL
jgi:hypothetical protein